MFTICSYTDDEWTTGATMERATKQADIARLRAHIATIERRPALAEAEGARTALGANGLPSSAPGLLQEFFTDEQRNSGALLGFALAQAQAFLSRARPAIIYLQLATEAQEMGLPYGPGLPGLGLDPATLILVRPASVTELLWAAEEAVVCKAVAAVIADMTGHPKALDFTAARRLGLRAGNSGTSMFFLRYGTWREASPAPLRWHVLPATSAAMRFDDRASGNLRWRIRLEKDAVSKQDRDWLVEWTKNGLQPANHHGFGKHGFGRHGTVQRPALPGAYPAQLGHGYDQTA